MRLRAGRTAFSLEKGQISPPVADTPFGVTPLSHGNRHETGHQSLDRRGRPAPGTSCQGSCSKSWYGTRGDSKAKIEFTDAWPHFAPGTHELAVPATDSTQLTSGNPSLARPPRRPPGTRARCLFAVLAAAGLPVWPVATSSRLRVGLGANVVAGALGFKLIDGQRRRGLRRAATRGGFGPE